MLASFLIAAALMSGQSQTVPVTPQSALEAPAASPVGDTNGYVLGKGDVVSLNVIDMPEVSQAAVRVGPDGRINLPLVGGIQAAGLTLSALKAELTEKLSKYINDPQITLNLAHNGSRFVSVLGEVNSPGVHALDGPLTLVQVLSVAGGVKADAGPKVIVTRDLDHGSFASSLPGQVVSGRSVRVMLPLDALLASSSPEDNIVVQPGDVISVPKEQLIYVIGDVHRAGGFPMASHNTVSVLQAISLAEGSGPNAKLKAAKILRPQPGSTGVPKELPVDLKAILEGKAPDQPLYANDVLFVPNSAASSGVKRAGEVLLQVATGLAIYR